MNVEHGAEFGTICSEKGNILFQSTDSAALEIMVRVVTSSRYVLHIEVLTEILSSHDTSFEIICCADCVCI